MKIVYSGGYNKNSDKSIKASFINSYHSLISKAVNSGKKIAFVTLAKPDGYYDNLIYPLYNTAVDVIDSAKLKDLRWSIYDGIFIFGGNEMPLYEGLKKTNFSLNKLKKNVVILGDSAGAYVLSSYFYSLAPGKTRDNQIKFFPGFNPDAKVITVAHKNNPVYCNEILIANVNKFAKSKNVRVLMLNENEQKLLRGDQFIEFDKNKLFAD